MKTALEFHTRDERGRYLCNQDGVFHFSEICPGCKQKIESRKEKVATMPLKRVFHIVSASDKKIVRKIECWCNFTAYRFASEEFPNFSYNVVEVTS